MFRGKTEYIKILEGVTKAKLFMFDFPDKLIISSIESIKQALSYHKFKIFTNEDKLTQLAVIKLEDIKHLEWGKE